MVCLVPVVHMALGAEHMHPPTTVLSTEWVPSVLVVEGVPGVQLGLLELPEELVPSWCQQQNGNEA